MHCQLSDFVSISFSILFSDNTKLLFSGGHPRNWEAVLDACRLVLDSFGRKLKEENGRLSAAQLMTPSANQSGHGFANGTAKTNGHMGMDRQAMMVPTHMQHGTSTAAGSYCIVAVWRICVTVFGCLFSPKLLGWVLCEIQFLVFCCLFPNI